MNNALRETGIYTVAAAAAFGVDVAALWLLVEVCGIHYLVSAAIAFVAGTAVVYWISIRHAFAFRRVTDVRREFSLFAVIGALGILINLGILYIAVEHLKTHYLVAKVLASGVTFVTNFGLRKTMLFMPLGGPTTHPSCRSRK